MEAFRLRQKYEAEAFQERSNFTAWLNGIYISHAISACFAKNAKYPDRPIDLTGKENRTEQDAVKFEAWAHSFNKEFNEKK